MNLFLRNLHIFELHVYFAVKIAVLWNLLFKMGQSPALGVNFCDIEKAFKCGQLCKIM